MKKEQIIEKYKEKYSSDIIHPCQLTIHELQMLDFCIEYFASELSDSELGVGTAEEWFDENQANYKGIKSRHYAIQMLKDFTSQFQQRPLPAEYFNSITDLRIYLLRHPNREMVRQSCLHYLGDQFQQPEITDEIIAIKKISAGVYLTFHTELSLSLDDCEKITEFILKGYDDLISLKAQKA